MGSSLIQAPLPRDGSGRVDLEAVGRALAAIAGATPVRRAVLLPSAALIERLSTLDAPAASTARVNGHAVTAPAIETATAPIRRETHSPATPDEPAAAKPPPATDVRGIGRVGPEPVRLEDLAEKPTSFPVPAPVTPQPPRPSEPRSIEASAGPAEVAVSDAVVAVSDEVDLGPLPPLDARGSVFPPALAPTPRTSSIPPVAPAPVVTPAPASISAAPSSPAVAGSRPLLSPFPTSSATRATHGALPHGALAAQPSQAAPAEAVGAVFDEFLGSAPVEPAPRPAPPANVPRAAPSLAAGLRLSPSLQVPVFRPPPVPVGPASSASRPPIVRVLDDEAIEPVEVEEMEMEVEEIVASTLSRPPALPPLPPKKR